MTPLLTELGTIDAATERALLQAVSGICTRDNMAIHDQTPERLVSGDVHDSAFDSKPIRKSA